MAKKPKKQQDKKGQVVSPVSKTDPQGSWTGTPADGGMPVQDADDL